MLDDSDVDFAILISNPKSWLGLAAFIIFIVVLVIVVQGNKDECEAKTCATGQVGRLLNHECLCVSKPLDQIPASDGGSR